GRHGPRVAPGSTRQHWRRTTRLAARQPVRSANRSPRGEPMRCRPHLILCSTVVAVALLAAACGSSSSGSSGTDGTSGGGSSTDGGGDPIVIGGVANMQYYPGVDDGAQARFERENRSGGVEGRSFKFLGVQDDAHDEQRNTTIVRSLV